MITSFISGSSLDKKEIESSKYSELPKENIGKVYAIDGGNSTIYDGGTWILQKARVSIVGYNEEKILEERNAAETHIVYGWKNNEIEVKLNKIDKFPKIDFRTVKFEEIGDSIRKILELKVAVDFIDKLKKGDILLIDGILKAEFDEESEIIGDLISKAGKIGVNLVGIAKTSRMRTKSGANMLGLLIEKAEMKRWRYELDKENLVVKLNPHSKNVFRMNLFGDIEKTLGILSYYSKDPLLVGYPYPLIRVDRLARISNHEKLQEKRRVGITAKNMGLKSIESDISTQNFHKKLDKRNFR